MSSRVSPIASIGLTICSVFAAFPAFAQNYAPPRRSVFISLSQAHATTEVRELYIAVMGSVARHGTYHVDPSELNLQSVVRRAGGLTADATGNIRIIRQGRVLYQVIFSEEAPKSENPVQPGDLLVVDSRQSPDHSGRVAQFAEDPATIHASYEAPSAPVDIQVALVNVLEYPVVVLVHPEDATLGTVVDLLGQPISLANSARVIAPSLRARTSKEISYSIQETGKSPQAIQLTGGTAVVFEKGSIDRGRLPTTLPRPIESDIAAGAQAGLIGNPHGQSPELQNLGDRLILSNVDSGQGLPALSGTDSIPSSLDPHGKPVDDQRSGATLPSGSANPRITTTPFTGTAQIINSSTGQSGFSGSASQQIPQPDDATSEGVSPALTMAAPLSIGSNSEAEIGTRSAPSTIFLFGTITAMLGGLGAGAFFLRRMAIAKLAVNDFSGSNNDAPSSPIGQQPTTSAAIATSLLDRILKNELPLRIEEIEFPGELILQGRIATQQVLRADDAHDFAIDNGPHFVGEKGDAIEPTLQDVIAQMDLPESQPRRPHFLSTPKEHIVGAGTSSDAPQASATSERSAAPLAKALLDLEQGDRA